MSEGYISDFVEANVSFLASNEHTLNLRDSLLCLYDFEAHFDTSLTVFRQMDLLLKEGVYYRLKLAKTPQFQNKPQIFDSEDDFFCVVDGFCEPPWLYAHTGSRLWKSWVKAGLLKGDAAQPPSNMHAVEVAVEVARLESQSNDKELSCEWFAFLAYDYRLRKNTEITAFKRLPKTTQFLDLVHQNGLPKIILEKLDSYPYDKLGIDARKIETDAFLHWWFRQKSSTKANPERIFSAMDKGVAPTSKTAILKKHENCSQKLEQLLEKTTVAEQWATLLVNISFSAYGDGGKWGLLYAARFLYLTVNEQLPDLNQSVSADLLAKAICRMGQSTSIKTPALKVG